MRMDAQARTRAVQRDVPQPASQLRRGQRQIVIPMTRSEYDRVWSNHQALRTRLEQLLQVSPELFPPNFKDGFWLEGLLREFLKLPGIRLWKIKLKNGASYELRTSFVMPYMTGTVDELKHPLFLLSLGTPCWAVTHIFGHNEMFWHRHLERLGHSNLVGCTVRDSAKLPEHLAADEHHVDWAGEKGYIATTVGGGRLLGVAPTKAADEEHLTQAYGVLAEETQQVRQDYSPQTVNTDGWAATQNAFLKLFPVVTIILCFLHGFLKIRDRSRKNYELAKQICQVVHEESAAGFRAAMQRLRQWCVSANYRPS